MKLALVVPLLTAEPAQLSCRSATAAEPEDGYVKMKINGAYVKIIKCKDPTAVGADRWPITATIPPRLERICTKPAWKQFDNVKFEAYLDDDSLQDELEAGVAG